MGQSHNCSGGRRRPISLGSPCDRLVQHWLSAVVSDWMKGKGRSNRPAARFGGPFEGCRNRTSAHSYRENDRDND